MQLLVLHQAVEAGTLQWPPIVHHVVLQPARLRVRADRQADREARPLEEAGVHRRAIHHRLAEVLQVIPRLKRKNTDRFRFPGTLPMTSGSRKYIQIC
jgi:hypothetical protein